MGKASEGNASSPIDLFPGVSRIELTGDVAQATLRWIQAK